METPSPVAAGTLGGVNLSGDPEDATLPPDIEQEPGSEPETPQSPDTPPEPDDAPQEPQEAPEQPDDESPPAEPDEPTGQAASAATEKKGGAPSREYVVLEEGAFEDDQKPYFTEVHRVEARNAQNAMRRAFKDLKGEAEAEATLVVVPATMWRPTKVKIQKTERTTVSFS